MQKLSNLPKWVRQLGGVFLAFVLFWLICDIAVDGSLTRKYHQQLLQEFPLIQPLPGSVVVKTIDAYSRLTPGKAGVGADYATNAAYPAIYQHYDKELSSKGWRFVEEHPTKSMSGDVGMERRYCKGPVLATLEYREQRQGQNGWTYGLNLSWGGERCGPSQ
jgi:hypothetical protein